jgi:flagellar biosynthesis/type III secretory pathway protein FliH
VRVFEPSAWTLEDLGDGAPADRAAPRAEWDAPAADPRAEAEALAAARDAEAAQALRAAHDAAVADAYARGYDEGRIEGELAEGARLRHAVAVAEQVVDELRAGESRWAGTIEENVCALAVAVARQLVGRELAADPEAVVALVRTALKEFPVGQPIVVRVSASDLAVIERVLGPGDGDGGAPGARWVADARVAPGGCLVEGRERIVDGRVDTGLERVYRRLTYSNA